MRTLKVIDADIRQVRARLMDSVRGTSKWKTAMEYLDKLLEERFERVKYEGKHTKK
jgi:fructose-specific component phosphotransferase system IIB-like protein